MTGRPLSRLQPIDPHPGGERVGQRVRDPDLLARKMRRLSSELLD